MNMSWIKRHEVLTQKLTGLTTKNSETLRILILVIYHKDT